MLLSIAMSGQAQDTQEEDREMNPEGSYFDFEEIVITGTHIPTRTKSNSSSPIDVSNIKELKTQGIFNINDLIATLPSNSGSHKNTDGLDETFSVGTTGINLRGLGDSATLTLLNGHRQTQTASTTLDGAQFTDWNALVPTIAIDRVEMAKNGASPIYGSDAVAGVVNFITKREFVGVELETHYLESGDGQEDASISALFGKAIGTDSHWTTAINVFDRSPLSAIDRRDEFELRNASTKFGQPGTFLINGVPTPDPQCDEVAESNPETTIYPGDTGFCGFDFGDFFTLMAEEERINLFTDLRVNISPDSFFFVNAGYVDNTVVATTSPTQSILFPQVVPTDNPGNFAGVPMLYFGRVKGSGSSPGVIDIESTTWRVNTGIELPINYNWLFNSDLSFSENTYDYSDGSDTKIDRFIEALNGRGGPDNDQYYNPRFGAENNPAVLADIRGFYAYEATATLVVWDNYITGKLFNLPGGAAQIVVGTQLQHSELEYDYNADAENDNLFFFIGNRDFDDSRDSQAVFVEMDMPLAENFNTQLALRYERHGEFDSLDPKIGFLWRTTQHLNFRGSYGTSFRAPSQFQESGGLTAPVRVLDPVIENFATVSQRTEGDPDSPLNAEVSDNISLGVVFNLPSGFNATVDYWYYDVEDFITPENATALVNVDPFGPQVTRDPETGLLLAVQTFFRNAGELETDGLDISLKKSARIDTGIFNLNFKVTYVNSYDLIDPVLGKVDGKAQRNFTNFASPMPEWQGTAGASWTWKGHNFAIYANYIDSYLDDNSDDRTIDSYTTVDLRYAFEMPQFFGSNKALTLAVGANNIADDMPPDVIDRSGYDTRMHDPLGRQVYISANIGFY